MDDIEIREERGEQTDNANPASVSADAIGILDTIDVPIVLVGCDYKVARFNRAAAEELGLTPSDVGKLPCNIQAMADAKGLEKLCAQVIADEAPCRRDIQNGDRWFLLRIAPYTGSGRQVRGAVLTFTNVTGFRASIGQAVYEREYTKTILNTVEPLVVLDAALKIQTANRAFYAMFGVSREETQGVPLFDLGNDTWKTSDLWPLLKATLSDSREFQTFEFERDFPTIGRRTVLLDARRLSRDGNALVLLVLRDVTERKRFEKELAEAAEHRQLALQMAALGAWEYRFDSGEIIWDERCRKLWGISEGHALDYDSVIQQVHPDDRGATRQALRDALTGINGGMYRCEFRVIWPDGSEHWIVSHGQVHFEGIDKDKRPVRFIGIAREITAEKRTSELLEQTVHERTVKLKETISELEAFSYSISHDMRAPLRAMQGYAEVLLEEYKDKLDSTGVHYLERIQRGASRLDLLIKDVLAYSKIAKGQVHLNVIDLDVIISDVIDNYPQIQVPNAEITVATPLPKVLGHEAYLTQIISNLLGNAVKFVSPGSQPKVRVWAETEGALVRVWFEDNGIGIEPRHHKEIFQIFGRVDADQNYEGTGIGLAIVRKAVERLGGSVGIVSALGEGSRFWITLRKP